MRMFFFLERSQFKEDRPKIACSSEDSFEEGLLYRSQAKRRSRDWQVRCRHRFSVDTSYCYLPSISSLAICCFDVDTLASEPQSDATVLVETRFILYPCATRSQ